MKADPVLTTILRRAALRVALVAGTSCLPLSELRAQSRDEAPAALAGIWAGVARHAGDSVWVAFEFEPAEGGAMAVRLSIPVIHVMQHRLGRIPVQHEGDTVRIGPFVFRHDPSERTLTGLLPRALVTVHDIPVTLRRVDRFAHAPRAGLAARRVEPVWIHDAGAPLWAGATVHAGIVYAGTEDGRIVALDAAAGAVIWTARVGGAVRARPAVAEDDLYVQADDGYLYRFSARSGEELWRVRVVESPVERPPPGTPGSRSDVFASDVVIDGARVLLGTHAGTILALDRADGAVQWTYATGDAVLGAPLAHGGRVYAGSFDHHVYAVDGRTGRLVWRHDTGAPVVSSPAAAGARVIVGSRSYDLLALDAATGERAWARHRWFSWVESSVALHRGTGYVGSSDAASVLAFDPETGRRVWEVDVLGRALGRPAVTDDRVYVGTTGVPDYLSEFRGAVVALDRATGRAVWQFVPPQPRANGPFGFPGTVAVSGDRVIATGLDGRVYAFHR